MKEVLSIALSVFKENHTYTISLPVGAPCAEAIAVCHEFIAKIEEYDRIGKEKAAAMQQVEEPKAGE